MHWLFGLVVAGMILIACGVLLEGLRGVLDLRRASEYGRFVEIARGQRLFVSETGSAGPTIVFESGIIASGMHWSALQEALSGEVRTFSYDRFGLGWSGATREQRLPSGMAAELRRLLEQAGVAPPYVMVAHSYGSLIARSFAARFSEDVAGVMLVDPIRTEEWQPSNSSRRELVRRGTGLMRLLGTLSRVGFVRSFGYLVLRRPRVFSQILRVVGGRKGQILIEKSTRELLKMSPRVRSQVVAQWSRPAFFRSAERYFRSVAPSVKEAEGLEPLSSIPVIVLIPASKEPVSAERLERIGDQVEQRRIAGAGHWIHLDQPDVVLQAVRDLVKRSEAAGSAQSARDELRNICV